MKGDGAYLEVVKWEEHQHYKDRSPPWIKLHTKLLDDYEMGCLQDASKAHLMGIWLLAARLDNRIPADPTWIAGKINATEPVDVDALVSAGFLRVCGGDIEPLAGRLQDASPRAQREEAEAEVETETDQQHRAREATALESYLSDHPQAIQVLRLSGGTTPTTEAGIMGQYGPGGTCEREWGRAPPDDRPRILAEVILRTVGDAGSWKSNLARAVLAGILNPREQSHGDGRAGRKGGAGSQPSSRRRDHRVLGG